MPIFTVDQIQIHTKFNFLPNTICRVLLPIFILSPAAPKRSIDMPRKRSPTLWFVLCFAAVICTQARADDVCPRPSLGSEVPELYDLRSEGGVLKAALAYRTYVDAEGQKRYCYND